MTDNLAIEMYRENILENYRSPKNFGKLKTLTNKAQAINKICGDEINMELEIKNNKLTDIKFNGQGCAITMASASLLTEKIKNMPIEKIKSLKREDALELLQIPISPIRIKCALLPLEAVQKALNK